MHTSCDERSGRMGVRSGQSQMVQSLFRADAATIAKSKYIDDLNDA